MTLNEYERLRDDWEAEDERDIEVAQSLYDNENSPDDPGNYSEAIGEMSDVDWKRIVEAFRTNKAEYALPILNALVDEYWWERSVKEARKR